MVIHLVCFMFLVLLNYANVPTQEISQDQTQSTSNAQFEQFKNQYSVALSDPFSYSRIKQKPVLFVIFATWSNTYEIFQKNYINDPLIREYLSLFEVIQINGDDKNFKELLPKRYWTDIYPAIIAFSESKTLGHLRGEDTVDVELFYKQIDFWFEQWRKDIELVSGKKPIHPLRYFYEEDYKPAKKVRGKPGYLLKTGWIVQGTPKKLSANVITFLQGNRETKIPLHLFTEESKKLLEKVAMISMREEASLVPGPFPIEFSDTLDNIPSINRAKIEAQKPVLLLIDPQEIFLKKLYDFNSQNPKTANTLSYVKKYIAGKSLSPAMASSFANFYKLEFPAIMVLRAGHNQRTFSNLSDPAEFYKIISEESLMQKTQAKTVGASKEEKGPTAEQDTSLPK